MSKRVLTITLNPAIDRFLEIKNFKTGKDFRADDLAVCAGGKGVNVARALRALGIETASLGITAGGAGRAIQSLLKREGLNFRSVNAFGESRVNFTILDRKNNRTTRLLGQGPKADRRVEKKFLEMYETSLPRSAWVIISGRGLEGLSDVFYQKLLTMAGKQKVNVAVDACPTIFSILTKSRVKPALIKFNEKEWQDLTGRRFSWVSAFKYMKKIYGQGVDTILITRAEKGAIGYNGKSCFEVRGRKVSSLFDVGCGDAFLAGFMEARIKGQDLPEHLKWASACAAASLKEIIPGSMRIALIKEEYSFVSVKQARY